MLNGCGIIRLTPVRDEYQVPVITEINYSFSIKVEEFFV
jgi:hypothetical protein